MARDLKRVLVPVDGSERSFQAVRYLGDVLPPGRIAVTLFHVFDPVPECYWDLEHQAGRMDAVRELRSWETEKKKKIESFMENARSFLTARGVSAESIEIKVQDRREGIARDILKEMDAGYDAVALARHGFGFLDGFVMGSVVSKLLSKISLAPVILVGDVPPGKKMLLAADGSSASERVAAVAGGFLAGSDHEVVLFHVVRGFDAAVPEYPDAIISPDRFEAAREQMGAVFARIKNILRQAGMEPKRISEKIVTGEFSRAGAILREAADSGCNAIAVGRRGISKVEAFFMGRVSNKVIHGGKNHAVWVI